MILKFKRFWNFYTWKNCSTQAANFLVQKQYHHVCVCGNQPRGRVVYSEVVHGFGWCLHEGDLIWHCRDLLWFPYEFNNEFNMVSCSGYYLKHVIIFKYGHNHKNSCDLIRTWKSWTSDLNNLVYMVRRERDGK